MLASTPATSCPTEVAGKAEALLTTIKGSYVKFAGFRDVVIKWLVLRLVWRKFEDSCAPQHFGQCKLSRRQAINGSGSKTWFAVCFFDMVRNVRSWTFVANRRHGHTSRRIFCRVTRKSLGQKLNILGLSPHNILFNTDAAVME